MRPADPPSRPQSARSRSVRHPAKSDAQAVQPGRLRIRPGKVVPKLIVPSHGLHIAKCAWRTSPAPRSARSADSVRHPAKSDAQAVQPGRLRIRPGKVVPKLIHSITRFTIAKCASRTFPSPEKRTFGASARHQPSLIHNPCNRAASEFAPAKLFHHSLFHQSRRESMRVLSVFVLVGAAMAQGPLPGGRQ